MKILERIERWYENNFVYVLAITLTMIIGLIFLIKWLIATMPTIMQLLL